MKKYRFFYHFRRSTLGMTVHYKGVCYPCKNVLCEAICETKWNKTQPLLILQGFSSGILVLNDTITIKK